MKINIKKLLCLLLVTIFLLSTNVLATTDTKNLSAERFEIIKNAIKNQQNDKSSGEPIDYDPLEDVEITINIKEIRAFDKIGVLGKPSFYVKIFVNGDEYTSEIWQRENHIKPDWKLTCDVPDDEEWVDIKIQLWDSDLGKDRLCDLSTNFYGNLTTDYEVELVYSIKSGHWDGEDYIYQDPLFFDQSGYGRLNGCDDNSIYQRDRDCELYFEITQNDPDGDGIPYWTETEIFGTDPEVNDTGRDDDGDGVPIEWENKWGHYLFYNWSSQELEHAWIYDPFEWENHSNIDLDSDGLDNIEENMTSQWRSDPFRKDIFLEIDKMELGPNGEGMDVPDESIYLLKTPFAKQNILLHVDIEGNDEDMNGGEMIPFDESTSRGELQYIYYNYFLLIRIRNKKNRKRLS